MESKNDGPLACESGGYANYISARSAENSFAPTLVTEACAAGDRERGLSGRADPPRQPTPDTVDCTINEFLAGITAESLTTWWADHIRRPEHPRVKFADNGATALRYVDCSYIAARCLADHLEQFGYGVGIGQLPRRRGESAKNPRVAVYIAPETPTAARGG